MKNYLNPKQRSLLHALVVSDFKIRYQGSVLGYLWSLVRPLSLFAVLYVMFTVVFNVGNEIPHYGVYLLLGVMLWNFFTEATNNGLSSLVDRGDMIRKVYTPKYAIVLAAVFSAALNLVINLFVVFVFALINGVQFSFERLILAPLPILQIVAFAVGISFLLSSLYVKFRDVKYIWELLLQIGFYASAVLYPVTLVPEAYRALLLANPVAQILQDARFAIVYEGTPTAISVMGGYAFIPYLIVVVIVAFSIWYFRRSNKLIAEEL
jgi:ABC-2 type transport system permease protein